MPTRLLLLADTHLPTRAKDLPQRVWRAVGAADVVIHAGDWVTPMLLDALEQHAQRLIGVWGNNDGVELRAACVCSIPDPRGTGGVSRPAP